MKVKTRCQQELGYLRGKVESLTQQVSELNQTICELKQLVASLSHTSADSAIELNLSRLEGVYSMSENQHSISIEVG
jgi:prefoldin subunit 5